MYCFIEDNMDTKETTIQLLKDLISSDTGLLPYTLYKRYGTTPIMLVQTVKGLQAKNYLVMDDHNRIMLTNEGRKNAEGMISSLSKASRAKKDSAFLISIKSIVLDRRKPFLPSRQFFEQYNKKEGVKNG